MNKDKIKPWTQVPNHELIDMAKKLDPRVDMFLTERTIQAMKNGGNVLSGDFVVGMNALYDTITNKVGMTSFEDTTVIDKLDWITVDNMAYGAYKELIGVGIAKTYPFVSGREYNPFVIEQDEVKVVYQETKYSEYQRQTIMDTDVKQAFLSESGVMNLVSRKMQSMQHAKIISRYLRKQGMIKLSEDDMAFVKTEEIKDSDSARAFVKSLVDLGEALSENTRDFNAMHQLTSSSMAKMTLIVKSKYRKVLTIDMLADTFNMSVLDLPQIKYLEEFGTDKPAYDETGKRTATTYGTIDNAVAMLVHNDFWKHTIIYGSYGSIHNPEGLYTNFFQHGEGMMLHNPFKPAILFCTDADTRKRSDKSIWVKQRKIDKEIVDKQQEQIKPSTPEELGK